MSFILRRIPRFALPEGVLPSTCTTPIVKQIQSPLPTRQLPSHKMSSTVSTKQGSAIETIAKDLPNGTFNAAEGTAWANPGPAAYNFFSDTATSGTPAMLNAIIQSTLLDDVFRSDPTTNSLESYIASLFGFESALLVLSGTMGNQLAIRAHLTDPPASVVCDARSHIITSEAGGMAMLSQAMPFVATPANGRYVTLDEVREQTVLDHEAYHMCPTRLICLENTIAGAVMPLDECERIAGFARENGIKMHLDGARIWEAVSAQVARGEHGGDFKEGLKAYGRCFDSVQACFSKGLGAPIGSVLLGQRDFIDKARHHRKAIGGGIRAAGVIAGPARVAVDETFLGGKLAATHVLARRVAERWESKGGKLRQPVETNMVWLDMKASGVDSAEWSAVSKEAGINMGQGRVVCHYQLCEDALTRLFGVMDKVLGSARSRSA